MSSADTHFHQDTHPRVRAIIESARLSGRKLRLHYGDLTTGRDWLEENDVVGFIGRSTGIQKAPLILKSKRSDGGPAVLDQCIVRLADANTGEELWRHPLYALPALEQEHRPPYHAKYSHVVLVAGQVHAAFETAEKACNWRLFMEGKRARA